MAKKQGTLAWYKPALLALAVGLLVGFALWEIPPIPRSVPPIPSGNGEIIFSRDGRLLATHSYDWDGMHHDIGHLALWDLTTGQELFRIPWNRVFFLGARYSTAFSPDGKQFAVAGTGKAELWDVASGKKQASGAAIEVDWLPFPVCELVTDAGGRLLWLVHENDHFRFRDLLSGEQLGSIPAPKEQYYPTIFPGGLLIGGEDAYRLWEFPEGALRIEVPPPSRGRDSSWALSADGGTLARIDGGVQVWDTRTGQRRSLDAPAKARPSLSTDGTLLAVQVSTFEEEDLFSRVVVYDLGTQRTIASFPEADRAVFVPDGRTLAVVGNKEILLYDLPLHPSWGKIAGYAGVAALVTFLLGWGLPLGCRRATG